MATVTKKELMERVALLTDQKRNLVKTIIQTFLDQIVADVGRGHRIEFRDFGVFEARVRKARIAQNPKTLDKVPVPPKRTVKFKIGRLMRRSLAENQPEVDGATGLPLGPAGATNRSRTGVRPARTPKAAASG